MNILIAADGSSYTKRMLAYLAAHDEWMGSAHRYTVVHCAWPLPASALRAVDRDNVKTYYAGVCEDVFKPIREFFSKQGLHAEFVSQVGDPGITIAEMADAHKFDLVVVGSHGHGTLTNLVLGSVATKVIAGSKVPVLVIR